MAKGIDQDFLNELKLKNPIEDVISSYIHITRRGNTLWACCPFHHEKTPSFAINVADQYYHCFGCGASGNVITFVKEYESVQFMESVRILAERAGMVLPDFSYDDKALAAKKQHNDRLLQVLRETARFYWQNLNSDRADKFTQYILEREIPSVIVRKFGLGASLSFNELPKFLMAKGFTELEMLDSGVVAKSDKGILYDFLAERLIYPIINSLGDVIAFSGRLLEKKPNFAKYKNTKETAIFNKSKNLYNINQIRKLKKEQTIPYIILVEGYMDVIALAKVGYFNCVASMGTSLTKEQAKLLKRYTDTIYVAYDGDFAGQTAAERSIQILKDENLNVLIVPLPNGQDPDDIIKKLGKVYFDEALQNILPYIDFKIMMLAKKYNLTQVDDRRKFIEKALAIIKTENSATVREELLKNLQKQTGTSLQSLQFDLENTKVDEKIETENHVPKIVQSIEKDKIMLAEQFVLMACLFEYKYTQNFDISTLTFENPVHKKIAAFIYEKQQREEHIHPSSLFDIFPENSDELNLLFEKKDMQAVDEDSAKYFKDCVISIAKANIEKRRIALVNEYTMCMDSTQKRELLKKIQQLTEEYKNF